MRRDGADVLAGTLAGSRWWIRLIYLTGGGLGSFLRYGARPEFAPVDAVVGAEAGILGHDDRKRQTGAMRSSGTGVRTRRDPVTQRHSVSVETGSTTR